MGEMMKTVESTQELVDTLAKVGLKVTPYKRGPLGKQSFAANLDRANLLRFWKGEGTVQVDVNPTLRQAVVVAEEAARTIERTYSVQMHANSETSDADILAAARRAFPVQARGLRITKVEITSRPDWKALQNTDGPYYATRPRSRFVRFGIRAVARIPKQENFLLVGYDETSQFISILPEKATTVKRAHEVLRPAGIPRTSPRQGEWFFVPTNRETIKQIEALMLAKPATTAKSHWPLDRVNGEVGWRSDWTSHIATETVFLGRDRYVRGVVYDNRPNRHGSLLLRDWHRVVRNREVVAAPSVSISNRYWD
jgi:hypothetical protein